MRAVVWLISVVLVAGLALLWVAPPAWLKEVAVSEPAYRADRLFKAEDPQYDAGIHQLAQRIEWREPISRDDIAPFRDRIDQRHGEDITLLFHAVASGNVSAVDALLAAGADPRVTDKATGSSRNFVYVLTLPGGALLDMAGVNQMLDSYLRNGGDPNGTYGTRDATEGNLTDGLAGSGNYEGLRMAMAAGGDPWMKTWNAGAPYTSAMELLASNHAFAELDKLIDAGAFDAVPQKDLFDFLVALSEYQQRRDATSAEIKRIARRVLKRNPGYVETATYDTATRAIFKDHWQDPLPGEIPWDDIRSDAVK